MIVVLQVLVLPDVTGNEDNSSQVEQRLAGSVVTVKVGSLVLAPWGSWLLWSWSWASWQLLVELDNLAHSLGIGGATNVLIVSKGFELVLMISGKNIWILGCFEWIVCGLFVDRLLLAKWTVFTAEISQLKVESIP